MKYTYSKNTGAGFGCLALSAMAAFYFGLVYVLSLWTDRNLDFWFSYFKGHEVDIPQWLSFCATLLAPIAIAGNVLMELCKFAI